MSAERASTHYVLRYVYAILTIVVVAMTMVLSALYIGQQDESQTYERVQSYHLESEFASDDVQREIAVLYSLTQQAIRSDLAGSAGPAGIRAIQISPAGILQSIRSRVERMSELQQYYGGPVFAAIIERTLTALDRIEAQMRQAGGATVETLLSIEVMAATVEQFDRLHQIDAQRELQALSRRQNERPRFLAILLACLAFGALVGGYLIRSLRLSMLRQHEAELALADSQERLHHMQKLDALGRLVGGIAHDFNNLLTVILGHTEILRLTKAGDAAAEAGLGEIEKAGQQAASLTKQLLAFSRRQQLQPKVLHLNEQIAGLEALLKRIIGEDIELHFSYVGDPCAIEVDPDQLRQVIMNLVANARDAMPAGGDLRISTENVEVVGNELLANDVPDGCYGRLTVADNGVGMDEGIVQRIFEPFFTTKEESHGTGLGLSTVHGVVTGSGGHIQVDSAESKGTTFQIYFPCTDKGVKEESKATDEVAPQSGSETILIVEDEESVLQFVETGLSSLGYSVATATSGVKGLDVCRHHSTAIDVILSDVVMPGMKGPEFMEQALRQCPDAVPIFMSGYTSNEVLRAGNTADAGIPLLHKPFKLDELADLIREQLAKRRR